MRPYSPIVCPLDGSDDAIMKVSAVYRAGLPAGSGGVEGLSIDTSGTFGVSFKKPGEPSALHRLLSPPKRPTRIPAVIGYLWVFAIMFFLAALIIWISAASREGQTDTSGFCADPGYSTLPDCTGQHLQSAIPFLLLSGGIGLAMFLVSLVLLVQRQSRYPQLAAQWQIAQARWDAMYYCAKHDVVFVPGELARPVERMFG